MKRKIIKLMALVFSLVMLAGAFSSCSTNSKTFAKDDGNNKISVAMYSLMTSLTKGNISYYITSKYGDYNSNEFWMMITDGETQMTYKDYYTYIVNEKVKTCIAALTLFDELGLKLTDDEIAAVDEEMAFFVENDGDGSKNTLNNILSAYGANYKTLRDYLLMNKKISKLSVHLYGENGGQIEVNVKQSYLDENYIAFRQILFPTYDYIYDADKYGDDIYYKVTSDGKIETAKDKDGKDYYVISYDTEKGVAVDSDNDGKNDLDDNGNTIYYVADSEAVHIAYNTVNGKRRTVIDENGYEIIEKFDDKKVQEVAELAEQVKAMVTAGDFSGFEDQILIYDTNYGAEQDGTSGEMLYLATNKTYDSIMTDGKLLDSISADVQKLEIGGYTLYKSDYGYHLIMRYAPETGAFSDSKYSSWFVDANKNYDFNTDLVNELFMNRIKQYTEGVTINEKYKDSVDISVIEPNYNFG